MVSLQKPFPLKGGRVGMGVEDPASGAVSAASSTVIVSTSSTPNPSPLQGEGSVPHV